MRLTGHPKFLMDVPSRYVALNLRRKTSFLFPARGPTFQNKTQYEENGVE